METQVIFYPSWLDADGKVRTGTSRENKAECLSFLKNTRNPERLKRPDIAHFVKVKTIEYIRIE